ncbi:MAG: FAD binding domain-containing protein [Chloroflexi bacterium]|nr:FAD binding domain-containing protein [Chloroflexota bacterium]
MPRQINEYARPRTVAEAVKLLKAPEAAALAGGTSLLGGDAPGVQMVVDLQGLPLNYVRNEPDGCHIGALTTLQAVAGGAVGGEAGALLRRAAALSAQHTERQAATLGGVLAAAGWNDLLVALVAVDAWARVVWSGGVEVVPCDVLARDRQQWLDRGTLITEVLTPVQPAGARFGFARVARTPHDAALVAVAVRVARMNEHRVHDTRVAVGGAEPAVVRLHEIERLLDGRGLNSSEAQLAGEAARQAVRPIDDMRATAAYRRAMVAVLIRRALAEATR